MCAGPEVTPATVHLTRHNQSSSGMQEGGVLSEAEFLPWKRVPSRNTRKGPPRSSGFATAGPGDHTQAAENHTGRSCSFRVRDRAHPLLTLPAQQGVGLHNPILMPNLPPPEGLERTCPGVLNDRGSHLSVASNRLHRFVHSHVQLPTLCSARASWPASLAWRPVSPPRPV